MVHTATVDFNNGRPTVVLDINTPDPFVNPDTNADDQNTILCGGEVRRITFKKQTSNREQLADCILCDPSICPQCNANSQLPYMSSAWIGRQHPTERGALPLVHQEDLWRVPDRPSFFAPGAQSAVARIAPPGPIMNVSFLNGRVYEVLYCNRKVCETCETKAASRVEYRPSLSEVYSRSVFGPLP